ncbi:MAG: hypothetical protein HY851_07635 [candidate division Zixibacteria bacterium]|nr:hypothetical protein [candidate division Zixibacteria bacterium]
MSTGRAEILSPLSLVVACLFVFASPSQADRLKGQMITWSNFSAIRSVAASNSHVYFATSNGITRYDKIGNRWELPLTGADGLDGTEIERIWASRFDDHLYAQTKYGYFEYDSFLDRWYPRTELAEVDTVYTHIAAPNELIPPVGFNYFSGGQLSDQIGRLVPISSAIQDNAGDRWLGTWGYGAAKLPAGSIEMQFLPTGLLQKRVNAMYQDDSLLVLGGLYSPGSRNGLTLFNSAEGSSSFIEEEQTLNFPAIDVTAIAADSLRVYIGTATGLLVMNRATRQIERRIDRRRGLADDSVSCLTVCADTIMIGTAAGLSFMRHDSISVVSSRLLSRCRIFKVEPQDSNLWIATNFGALRIRRSTGEVAKFEDPLKFTFGRVYDIVRRGPFLWMAADNGLLRVNVKTAGTEPFRLNLFSNVVRRLAVNDDVAAVTSDRGFTLVHYSRAKPITREFTTADGLPSDRINCLLLDGDFLWIGSDAGLTRFWWNNPDRMD